MDREGAGGAKWCGFPGPLFCVTDRVNAAQGGEIAQTLRRCRTRLIVHAPLITCSPFIPLLPAPFLNPFSTAPCGSGPTRSAPRAEISVGCRAIQAGLQEIVYQCKRQASIVDLNGRYCP